ncbi:hypothetical protein OJ252_1414 [Cryptosporidium canis]|uniref:Beta-lactamase-related domain-containing protein n=1 Tax=Cryptosporidium canis TaxID=195482 RepID=A0ABQ8P847_9CRYT|nr:hypothetical protein OJ252_1414 [Cryptosporidium canis]
MNHHLSIKLGQLEASDDDYYRLHMASDESEPVDPFDNKEYLINSVSKLTSSAIRFGVHHYTTKRDSKKNESNSHNKLERADDLEGSGGKPVKSKNRPVKPEKEAIDDQRGSKIKYWWSKYIRRQKKKKDEKTQESPKLHSSNNNYDYLLFGSSPGDNSNSTSGNIQAPRRLFQQEMMENEDMMNSNYVGNKMRPETYVPLEIKTSIFAAYFAAEPVLIHFSKTIARNRRVKYGQEIAIAEAFPRTVNNLLSSIVLARCDGTISIISQTKGLPVQSTRMFLVITCNDSQF